MASYLQEKHANLYKFNLDKFGKVIGMLHIWDAFKAYALVSWHFTKSFLVQ